MQIIRDVVLVADGRTVKSRIKSRANIFYGKYSYLVNHLASLGFIEPNNMGYYAATSKGMAFVELHRQLEQMVKK